MLLICFTCFHISIKKTTYLWFGDKNEHVYKDNQKTNNGVINYIDIFDSYFQMCTVSWDKMLKLWSAGTDNCSTSFFQHFM